MADIFKQLEDVIEIQSGELLDSFEDWNDFQPFILCRWLSFYNSEYAKLLNSTTNRLYSGIDSKENWYKLLLTILPKSKYRFIRYVKKVKKQKRDDQNIISYLARNMELSEREVTQLIDQLPDDFDFDQFEHIK